MNRRLGMLLADMLLGMLIAGAIGPLLVGNGMLQSQAAFWIAVVLCVAIVTLLHGTFRRPPDRSD
jgi:hypothetical protein